MKKTIAIASKGLRQIELKSWEQTSKYQQRGWKITMVF